MIVFYYIFCLFIDSYNNLNETTRYYVIVVYFFQKYV